MFDKKVGEKVAKRGEKREKLCFVGCLLIGISLLVWRWSGMPLPSQVELLSSACAWLGLSAPSHCFIDGVYYSSRLQARPCETLTGAAYYAVKALPPCIQFDIFSVLLVLGDGLASLLLRSCRSIQCLTGLLGMISSLNYKRQTKGARLDGV